MADITSLAKRVILIGKGHVLYDGSLKKLQNQYETEKNVSIKGFTAPILFKVWTFLKEDDGWLDVTVEALNANKQVILSRQFTDIPMHRNTITEYKGSFFANDQTLNFTAETEWADTLHLTY
jgi:ABC-type uncharacterized transport system ATPase subunit